jgi:hypothetical protein
MRTDRANTRLIAPLAAACLTVLLLALALAGPAGASPDGTAVKRGVRFLTKSKISAFDYGFKADAINALTAARKSGSGTKRSAINRFVSALQDEAPNYATTAGAAGKVMLAAVAAGKNPRCFGTSVENSVDLYGITNSFYSNGRYGTTAYDQAFAMLGLAAAHEKVPAAAIKFAKRHRGKFGWGFSLGTGSGDDVQSTALMIEALRAAGVKRSDGALQSAFKWITFQRNTDGGYNPDTPAGETNADATAMVIRAADALGKNAGKAKIALRRLQLKNGSFRLTPTQPAASKVLSTDDAVLALSGRHLPVVRRAKAATSCV